MNAPLPARKHPRLKKYDYSQNGMYFLTVCTKDRKRILSEITVGPDALIGPQVTLTDIGKTVDKHIRNIPMACPHITVEHVVIMPNHVHLLLRVETQGGGPMRASGPTVGAVIRAIKGLTTRELGYSIWQTKFHDHIIRDDNDFLNHWSYIDSNPAHWAEDEYY